MSATKSKYDRARRERARKAEHAIFFAWFTLLVVLVLFATINGWDGIAVILRALGVIG